jgi:hypothetical protein
MISMDFNLSEEYNDIQVIEHEGKMLIVFMNKLFLSRVLIPYDKVNELLVNKIAQKQSDHENEPI